MTKPTVNEDFKDFLTALKPDEYDRLEQSLKDDGCRDPLVVWASENILIDGHNRLEICEKWNITYTVKKMQFDDDDAVKAWIINNQLARRNLAPDAISLLRGMEYNLQKNDAHAGINQHTKTGEGQNDTHQNTAADLAEKHGVSPATIKRDGKFATAVETLKEVQPDLKQQIENKEAPAKLTIIKAAEAVKESPEKAIEILTQTPKDKKEVKPQEPALAMQYATMAISQLERIKPKDPDKNKALNKVMQWITDNR